MKKLIAVALMLILCGGAAQATIIVAGGNGGFELDGASFHGQNQGAFGEGGNPATPSGWTHDAPSHYGGVGGNIGLPNDWWLDENPNGNGLPDGNYHAWLQSEGATPHYLEATVTGLSVGTEYQATLRYNSDAQAGRLPGHLNVLVDVGGSTLIFDSGEFVNVEAGGSNTLPFHLGTSDPFVAESDTHLIRISQVPVGTNYQATMIDSLEVSATSAPIPEPAGLGLVGVALLAVRRKRS